MTVELKRGDKLARGPHVFFIRGVADGKVELPGTERDVETVRRLIEEGVIEHTPAEDRTCPTPGCENTGRGVSAGCKRHTNQHQT